MKNLILLLLLLPLTMLGQSNIGFNVAQDLKLATVGDDKGNDAFTANFILRADLQDNQTKYGYLVVGVEYEYANLKGGAYNRYSINFGYTFNQFRIFNNNNFELTILGNYGMTIRTLQQVNKEVDAAFTGLAGSMTLSYPIIENLRVVAIGQLSHRVDKNTLYGSDANYTLPFINTDASGFVGIQYVFKLKPMRKF
jgi:hypothetical protein